MRNAKDRIKKALGDLSRQTDFADISVKSIFEAAGVSKQSFYNYYLDKYDVVFDLFRDDIKQQGGDDVFLNPSEMMLNADKLAENKDLYLSAFYDDSYKILPYIVEYAYSKNIATLEKILGSDAVSEQDKYNVRVWVYGGMHIFTEWLAGRIDTPKEKLLEYSYNSVPDIIKRAEKLK